MNVSLPLQKRGTVVVGTLLTWDERSKDAINLFSFIPGLKYVNEDQIRFMSRLYYDIAVLVTYLFSPYCILIRSCPRYDFLIMLKIRPRQPRP